MKKVIIIIILMKEEGTGKFSVYEDLNGKVKKVAAGVNANDLSYQDYIDLMNGKEVTTQKIKMNVN
jgi:hypothetical protein